MARPYSPMTGGPYVSHDGRHSAHVLMPRKSGQGTTVTAVCICGWTTGHAYRSERGADLAAYRHAQAGR